MKKRILYVAALLFVAFSCQKEEETPVSASVSDAVLTQISGLGFSTQHVIRLADGYLVEGDIVLNDRDFLRGINKTILRIAETEQYRTNNLVGAPSVIKISVAINHFLVFPYQTDAVMIFIHHGMEVKK